jgi:hypothetical protein
MSNLNPEEDVEETVPDSLLTITWPSVPVIQSDQTASTSKGDAELVWHGIDEPLAIRDAAIPEPLLYSSGGAPSTPEASCLDTTLSAQKSDDEDEMELGYWPQYANLSPSQRDSYIDWLATGREKPLTDYGYLFLFFFGLERRMLVDGEDAEPIIRELLKLRKRYSTSDAFFNTATHFIAFVFATVNIKRIRKIWFERLYVRPENELHEDSLVVALTWLHKHKNPLPGAIAYQIALKDVRCRDSVVIQKAGPEFRRLFLEHYESKFPDGVMLQTTSQMRVFAYRPLNPSLQGWRANETLQTIELPDILGASDQFMPLVEMWNECIETLRPTISSEDVNDWDEWKSLLSSCSDERGEAATTIKNIVETFGIEPAFRSSLSMEQSLELQDNACIAGISIEPSPDAIFRPYRTDDIVAVVPIHGQPDFDTENLYLAAALMLQLGIGMAAADAKIEGIELLHLPAIANAQFHFGDDDRKRITAWGNLLLARPPKTLPISLRLPRELRSNELNALGKFLIGIAASNGVVEPSELHAIESAFRAFGLSNERLKSSLLRLDIDYTTTTPPENQMVDQGKLNDFLAGLGTVAGTIGAAYRRIRTARKDRGISPKSPDTSPEPGTGTYSIDSAFDLSSQHANYHEDSAGTRYTLRTASNDADRLASTPKKT